MIDTIDAIWRGDGSDGTLCPTTVGVGQFVPFLKGETEILQARAVAAARFAASEFEATVLAHGICGRAAIRRFVYSC